MKEISILEIEGFRLGNREDKENGTGCTVIFAENGAVPGVDVRGGAPGTRETDLIRSEEMMPEINAVVLAGGSAYGLEAASGVMAFLEEHDIGFDTGFSKVPIVPSAVLFDLAYKNPKVRPDKEMGYEAMALAMEDNYKDGPFGAGSGATVGKIMGVEASMKSGIGSYAIETNGLKIGAVVAVNAFGSIYEGSRLIAGPLMDGHALSTEELMIQGMDAGFKGNTTIGCVISNAKLTKSGANKMASMGHDGFARAIRPIHTMVDGDTLFFMAKGEQEVDLNILGTLTAIVVEKAVHAAIKSVTEDELLKTYHDIFSSTEDNDKNP